ncbi:MAG: hypothetical protein P1V81_10200 [Planctomycetota bacterium]|nr:hypothetical protein [Planctomycetota bacterium]
MAPRVLFLTSPKEDYLQDSVMVGLRGLLGADAVDLPRKPALYEDEPRTGAELYGRGFTIWKNLKVAQEPARPGKLGALLHAADLADFDLVLFGSVRRQARELRTARLGRLLLGPRGGRPRTPWAFLDGEDATDLLPGLERLGTVFKRERLDRDVGRAEPISFGIPAVKLVPEVRAEKARLFSTHVQCEEARKHPWIAEHCNGGYSFEREADYFADLADSHFAVTMKKAGWDCMRHYEIAANGAVPCFWRLNEKPAASAPHELVDGVNCVSFDTVGELQAKTDELLASGRYGEVAEASLRWARAHTAEAVAGRVLARLDLAASP